MIQDYAGGDTTLIGKIHRLGPTDTNAQFFWYKAYLRPKQVLAQKLLKDRRPKIDLSCRSSNEVIETGLIYKEFYSNILQKVRIVDLDTYMDDPNDRIICR